MREDLVAPLRDVKNVFSRGEDETPPWIRRDLLHQLDKPLVLVFLKLFERCFTEEVIEIEEIVSILRFLRASILPNQGHTVCCESLTIDKIS